MASGRFPAIAFVSGSSSSFVVQDKMILSNLFQVTDATLKGPADATRLLRAVGRSQVIVIWFASGSAAALSLLLGKVLRKKFLVIVGGSEVSPESRVRGRGMRSKLRYLFTNALLNSADYVVSPSNFSLKEVLGHSRPKRSAVIYHGVDTEKFKPGKKGDTVLTVAFGQVERKGIDRFLRVASLLPHREFVIAGPASDSDFIRNNRTPNLRPLGPLSSQELVSAYQSAKFYCQLSRHEGFGVAVAEAMSCGCTPIVSDAGALPEVVGDCGFVTPNGDTTMTAEIIERNWDRCSESGRKARDRVVSRFSIERRSAALKKAISEIQSG
jgi:glycosyltransferase involved in cell wall biosynthesis